MQQEEQGIREIKVIGIRSRVVFERFDLAASIFQSIRDSGETLLEGDILALSSKFVAVSEGRFLKLEEVSPGMRAQKLGRKFAIDTRLAQLVIRESKEILGGVPGFLLALTKDGVLAPNAGIDRSNAPTGFVVLYPKDPNRTASRLRENLVDLAFTKEHRRISKLGIVLIDSRITPTRLGTTGVAIASSGMVPVEDLRGSRDLFGNELKVTIRGIADQIASSAQLVMGESREARPIAILRGVLEVFRQTRTNYERNLAIAPEKCLILRGLKNAESEQDIASTMTRQTSSSRLRPKNPR